MQRPGLAARRFYRAFYRWKLILSHAERQHPSSAVCASAFHSSVLYHDDQVPRYGNRSQGGLSRRSNADHISLKDLPTVRNQQRVSDDDGRQASRLKIRRHKSHGPTPEGFETTRLHDIQDRLKRQEVGSRAEEHGRRHDGRLRGNNSGGGQAEDSLDVQQAMLEGEVVSAAVKPFHSMAADEYVVRFRSEAGLMLEYAIAGDILEKAQKEHGARLERLKDRRGARIEVQELFKQRDGADDSKPQNMVHSVLISGTFKEVAKVYGDLRKNYSEVRAVKLQDPTDIEQESRKEKPQDKSHSKFYLEGPVRSTAVLPSSDLPLYKMCIRSRTADHLVIERVVSAQVAARWQDCFGDQFEVLKWRYRCDMTIKQLPSAQGHREGQDEHQPPSKASPQTKYTLRVEGPWESQYGIAGHLATAKEPLPSDAAQPSTLSLNQMKPGSSVFRRSPDMDLTLELAVTDNHLQHLMTVTEFARLAQALKVTVSTQYAKLRKGLANHAHPGGKLMLEQDRSKIAEAEVQDHLITLAGPKEALITMRSVFKLIIGRLRKSRAEDGGEKARDTVDKIIPQDQDKTSVRNSERPFTSLVEICPEDDQHQCVRAHVFAQTQHIRGRSRVSLFVSRTGLYVITGNEDNVNGAKKRLLAAANEAYQKFSLTPQGIRIIHERRDWKPSWREVNIVLTQTGGSSTQDRSDESLELWSHALYRCVVQVSGPRKENVIQAAQLVSSAEQLRSASGCQDVAIAKDAFIAHGSLDSILKFRHEARKVIRKMQDSMAIRSTKIDSRVHASLSSVWARMPWIDERDGADRVSDPQVAEDVRVALRPLSHPVVLITSQSPSFDVVEDTKYDEVDNNIVRRCRGITVSSFNTVTLRPDPLVSFNIKIPSSTWEALSASGDLRIHLLAATPRGAAIADAFTKKSPDPFSGFLRLQKLGVDVTYFEENAPPRVNDKEGVLAELHAKLLPQHCVKGGDHIVVVARVTSCRLPGGESAATPLQMDAQYWDSIGGLAYAKQEYRNVGARILPEGVALLPEDLPDPLSLGDGPAEQDSPRTPFKFEQRDLEEVEGRPTGDQPAVKSAKEVDFEKAMGAYEDLSPAAREEEDDYSFGFENPNYGVKRDHLASAATGESDEARDADALWGSEDIVREDSIRLAGGGAEPDFDSSAKGNKQDQHRSTPTKAIPPGSRSFSTFARPMALHARSSRHFSTAARMVSDSVSRTIDIDQLVDPSARDMNVADYLGVPETGRFHSHRVRSLFRMNKEARRAEKQLLECGTELTEEDKAELRQKITTNDRIISKKLAWNAAYHLRIMLDKGRVDFKRAQFLESAIEKGQAILLEEATMVRDMYNQGKISFDRLQMVKEKLARDADVYQTELARLGQIVDEEGDAGAVFPEPNEEGSGDQFDGLRGSR